MEPFPWWSQEHIQFAQQLEEFVESSFYKIAPNLSRRTYPSQLIQEIRSKGWLGVFIPKQYGGMGLGFTGACILLEGLSRLGHAAQVVPGITIFGGGRQILLEGNPEQKQRWLPRIARGEISGAIVITEPYVGSDAASIELVARKQGDVYVLDGKKRFITQAGLSDIYMVYARTSDDPQDRARYTHLSAFIVEAPAPGLRVERIYDMCGYDGVYNGILDFQGVEVPEENMLGKEGDGWRIMVRGLNVERTLCAAGTLGGIRECIRYAIWHSSHRVQFGSRLIDMQHHQFQLSEMMLRYQLARLCTYYSAWLLDQGKYDIPIQASTSKIFSTESYEWISRNAIQLMGGDGWTKWYPLEMHYRESKITPIYAGTNEVLRLLSFREGLRAWAHLFKPPRRKIHPESGIPADMGSLDLKLVDGIQDLKDLDPQTKLLKILGEYYKVNPGLYMDIDHLEAESGIQRSDLMDMLESMEKSGLVLNFRDRSGKIQMVRPSYSGLRKAYPLEHYAWYPPWIQESRDEHKLEFLE